MFKKTICALITILVLIPSVSFASFKDVPETNGYYNAVKYLEDSSVVNGSDNTNFNPDTKITKADLLKMILLESKITVSRKNTYTGFSDVIKNIWYAPYVKKALDMKLIEKSEFFYPKKPVRKWEALEMIFELKGVGIPKFLGKDVTFKFKDVKAGTEYAGVAKAAEKLNIFEKSALQPQKMITRGEVAEILYKLSQKTVNGEIQNAPTITIQLNSLPVTDGLTTQGKFPILVNVWESIKNSYIEKDEVDENKLMYGAIFGMVNTLKDPYSTFQEPLAAQILQTQLSENYEGIGVMVEMINNHFTVVSPLPGTPAEQAGVQAGDIITHVNGEDISGMSTEAIVSKIKGPAGTKVKLSIKRDGKEMSLDVERAKISLNAVTGELKEPTKIGFIRITNFAQNTAQSFIDKVNSLIAEGARGLIVDLRSNPGGYLDEVVKMLNYYVPEQSIMLSTKYGDKSTEMVFSVGPSTFGSIKTYMLVNKGTASASEIFAGVLQDYEIGKVVGEKTFGKGTVQQLTNYSDGSSFKLTIAKWLTAKERSIEGVGITPDIETKDDKNTQIDEVYEKALEEILKEL